jgi:hypothetical protein
VVPTIEIMARVDISGNDIRYGVWCDRCATDGSNTIMLLSVAGPTRIIQGVSATISRGGPAAEIRIDNQEFTGPLKRGWTWERGGQKEFWTPDKTTKSLLRRHPDGYTRLIHRIAYGHAHCIFVARQPGLLLNTSDRAIEQSLRDPNICTTPFLPEWVPYIAGELRERKLLNDLYGFQCKAAIIRPGSTADIDAIVLEGGQGGKIAIPA